jgi:hypothetical protein
MVNTAFTVAATGCPFLDLAFKLNSLSFPFIMLLMTLGISSAALLLQIDLILFSVRSCLVQPNPDIIALLTSSIFPS